MTAPPRLPLTIRFRTSYLELTRAVAAINAVRTPVRVMRWMARAALAAVAVIVLTGAGSGETAAVLLIFGGMWLVLLWLIPPYSAWLSWRTSPMWKGDVEYSFGDSGIRSTAFGSAGFTRWDAVTRVAETKRFVLFFITDHSAYFIPKRALPDADAAAMLAATLRDRAGRSPPGEPPPEEPPVTFAGPARVASTFEWRTREMTRAMVKIAHHGRAIWVMYLVVAMYVTWATIPRAHEDWRRGGWRAVDAGDLLVGLLPLVVMVTAVRLSLWYFTRRHLRTGPSTAGPQTLALHDEGIAVRGGMYTGSFRWALLMKAIETKEFFLFFVSKVQAIYLPKRTLSAADVRETRQLLRRALGDRAELRPDVTGG